MGRDDGRFRHITNQLFVRDWGSGCPFEAVYRGVDPTDGACRASPSSAPQQVAAWLAQMPDWVIVRPPLHIRSDLGLDPGEAEAISLALELSIPAIIIDEKRGRVAAEKCGISAVGTLNILEAAHSHGFLNFEDAVGRLRRTNFHMDNALIEALIAKIRAREGV